MELSKSLQSIAEGLGLQETDVRVYSSLLELGRGDAARIAKHAQLPRTTVYSVIKRLSELGLVGSEKRAHGQRFIPASSESIVRLAEEKLEKAKHGLAIAREVAEALKTASGRDALSQSKIQIYEGERAVRAALYDQIDMWRNALISTRKVWTGFQDDSYLVSYGEWVVDYWKRYKNAPNAQYDRVKLFSNATKADKDIASRTKEYAGDKRQLRPLPSGISFSSTIWVVGYYVITLHTRTSPHAMTVIRDEVLAENLGSVFEYLWNLTLPAK
ncbi:hypothetical protein JNK13_10135 [bacterium]|nr:hypothetical protein [bacterium]